MTDYLITASDPNFDLEADTFLQAVDMALDCARQGSTRIAMYEEIDWLVCLTPDERARVTVVSPDPPHESE